MYPNLMVPEELKSYNQWVLWRETTKPDGTKTKLPYSVSGGLASVSDYKTWTSYEKAAEASERLDMGIGFVLTENDPYAFVDLDSPYKNTLPEEVPKIIEQHQKILQAFDTYTEVSPSGTGLHLILKGAVEKGRRKDKVEIYSSDRYMTMTGNTLYDKPIEDRGYLLQQLWSECGSTNGNNGNGEVIIQEQEQRFNDKELYEIAEQAENGEKFVQLWQGKWMEAGYKSQSEADFSLINILSFYSRNVEQIRRMFFLSALGQRDKAKRKTYLDGMIKRSFDNVPVYIPLETIRNNLAKQLKEQGVAIPDIEPEQVEWVIPPGILGDIATFIYKSAPRPVKEIAIAGAIGLMAGICGRSYNISGTGLNQYMMVLAGTGTGKEAIASGMDKLMRHVRTRVPAAGEFIGPTEIASGQALIRYLQKHPCFVSVVGEFGLALQYLCAPNANSSQIMLRKKLLELYNKSGEKDILHPTVYSDKDKNIASITSPAFTLLGESTPESYYASLDETMISQGLLPRFLGIVYAGPRPALNAAHMTLEPDNQLVDAVAELCNNSLMMMQNHRVVTVPMDAAAQKFADDFEKETTKNINESQIVVAKELWNRAHLKMLKLSALVAIGINAFEPVVTLPCVQWAHAIVERDILSIFTRFETGKVGKNTSEEAQIADMKDIIRQYVKRPFDETMQRYLVEPLMHQEKVVQVAYLHRRLAAQAAFRHDRMGAAFAIRRTLEFLVSDGLLQEVRQPEVFKRYGKSMKCYAVVDLTRLGV